MTDELPIWIDCRGESLFGMLHNVDAETPIRGLVIVVGGPQYRVGSHRQFVLLARAVARAGIPALRFDYRGMGDSTGPSVDFESIDADIEAAVDTLCQQYPSLKSVALWGLCDAASAVAFYAGRNTDRRIGTLIMLNPWVRTEAGEARAQATGYYGQRLTSAQAWLELLRDPARIARVARNLLDLMRRALSRRDRSAASLPERVLTSLFAFDRDVLLVISGNDLTGREFIDVARDDRRYRQALKQKKIMRFDVPAADHTFSTAAWRDVIERQTTQWLQR